MAKNKIEITTASDREYSLIARHFYQLWLDLDFQASDLISNWQEKTLSYIDYASQNLQYRAFLAKTEERVIGSVSCQLFDGLYPLVFKEKRRCYGYIWGVYVEKPYRNRGVGKQLTKTAVSYLQSINCTRAVLHASPQGKPVYENLDFVPSNQMHLDL